MPLCLDKMKFLFSSFDMASQDSCMHEWLNGEDEQIKMTIDHAANIFCVLISLESIDRRYPPGPSLGTCHLFSFMVWPHES